MIHITANNTSMDNYMTKKQSRTGMIRINKVLKVKLIKLGFNSRFMLNERRRKFRKK